MLKERDERGGYIVPIQRDSASAVPPSEELRRRLEREAAEWNAISDGDGDVFDALAKLLREASAALSSQPVTPAAPVQTARELAAYALGLKAARAELAAAASPSPETSDTRLNKLDEFVLKPLLVQLKWAVSHDPSPDKFTENIATFLAEAEKSRAALQEAQHGR